MTPEAQRIAISQACPHLFVVGNSVFGITQLYWLQDGKYQGAAVDPLNDLNAMHEAERILGLGRCDDYEALLQQIVATESISKSQSATDGRVADLFNWHATAAQRAEAFLRTLGLWKDEV